MAIEKRISKNGKVNSGAAALQSARRDVIDA
jgi:hypothetical protein